MGYISAILMNWMEWIFLDNGVNGIIGHLHFTQSDRKQIRNTLQMLLALADTG